MSLYPEYFLLYVHVSFEIKTFDDCPKQKDEHVFIISNDKAKNNLYTEFSFISDFKLLKQSYFKVNRPK